MLPPLDESPPLLVDPPLEEVELSPLALLALAPPVPVLPPLPLPLPPPEPPVPPDFQAQLEAQSGLPSFPMSPGSHCSPLSTMPSPHFALVQSSRHASGK